MVMQDITLATFIRRRPHPASVIASLRSNKRLHKPDWKDPGCHYYVRCYILSLLLVFRPAIGQLELIPKGPGNLTDARLSCTICNLAVVKHGNQKDHHLPIIIVHSRINGNLVRSLFSLFIYARHNIDDRKKGPALQAILMAMRIRQYGIRPYGAERIAKYGRSRATLDATVRHHQASVRPVLPRRLPQSSIFA